MERRKLFCTCRTYSELRIRLGRVPKWCEIAWGSKTFQMRVDIQLSTQTKTFILYCLVSVVYFVDKLLMKLIQNGNFRFSLFLEYKLEIKISSSLILGSFSFKLNFIVSFLENRTLRLERDAHRYWGCDIKWSKNYVKVQRMLNFHFIFYLKINEEKLLLASSFLLYFCAVMRWERSCEKNIKINNKQSSWGF